jgi:DNA polymerase-1
MPNLLLIDGNNLAFRVHWTNKGLNLNGVPVSLLYGFFRSLVFLKKKYPDHFTIIAWDSTSKRRMAESLKGVEDKIIPSEYKANRKKNPDEPEDPDIACLFEQMPVLKEALQFAKVMQVTIDGYEADDVLCSYTKWNKAQGNETVLVTSDHDYYQLIDEKIYLFDAMKQNFWTKKVFTDSYGFEPYLWVDVGSLAGDSGDNIISVKGVGEKTATSLIKQYGKLDNVLEGLKNKAKRSKREEDIINCIPRIRLAYSLKKMDVIDKLPALRMAPRKKEPLIEWFRQFKFNSLIADAHFLV